MSSHATDYAESSSLGSLVARRVAYRAVSLVTTLLRQQPVGSCGPRLHKETCLVNVNLVHRLNAFTEQAWTDRKL